MRYRYQAQDQQGQSLTGFIEADNPKQAGRQLRQRQLTVIRLDAVNVAQTAVKGKAKAEEVLTALHELTTLLESGVSLIEAIESMAEGKHHPQLQRVFTDMAAQLRQGLAFSACLQQSNLKLPWYLLQLVGAGELTGQVAQALRDGVEQMEYEQRTRGELRNAMIYPLILIVSGIAAVMLIFVLVVPRFAGMLKNQGDALPWLAQAVLSTGMFVNQYIVFLLLGLGSLVFVGLTLWQQAGFRAKVQAVLLDLPLLGDWLLESEIGRWASMMATLLANKVALLRALESSRQGIQFQQLAARFSQVSHAVRAGTPLSQALQDNHAMTATGHNLIRAGEKAGKLPQMLRSLARLYETSSHARMKQFLTLIEPLAILLIGSVIGVIIIGIILAITSVNNIDL